MKWLFVICVASLAACGDREAHKLAKIRDEVCHCKTAQCADEAMAQLPTKDIRSTPRAQKVAREMLDCLSELYKADLVTSEGKVGSIFLAELAPGANMGKHYHPGDAFAYILEGTMLLEIAGGQSVTLKQGQSGSLPPGTVHDDKNASTTAPLKFLVFHVAKKGDPLAVPAP